MVDAVLHFEGERNLSYRLLRAVKNRFGSTNEVGVFEMADVGLEAVENPSAALLEGRPVQTSGNCVACVMEGTRPAVGGGADAGFQKQFCRCPPYRFGV